MLLLCEDGVVRLETILVKKGLVTLGLDVCIEQKAPVRKCSKWSKSR